MTVFPFATQMPVIVRKSPSVALDGAKGLAFTATKQWFSFANVDTFFESDVPSPASLGAEGYTAIFRF
jgi:hypothetical protein